MKRSAKAKNKIALDIGSHSVKMLEVSTLPAKTSLVSFGIKKIQGSSGEAITDAIKALANELKVSLREVTISLTGPSLVARPISMPKMTDEELENAVRFEVERFIPFDSSECVLDFHVQGADAREQKNLDILLAAAKRDFVLQKIKTVEDAGFDVNVIDVDSFAVTNAFIQNFAAPEGVRTVALLNIGATYTNLVILKDKVISSVRDIAIGTNDFNAVVSKKCGLTADVSEALASVPNEKMGEVMACAKAALAKLLDEIKLSFVYHENQSGAGIDEIFISGGGAHFPALGEAFSETLGSKPNEWNPFQFMDIDSSKIKVDELLKVKDSFAVAVGLALR